VSREKKPRKQTAKPAKPTSKQALTLKQEKFVQAYIETGNASEAYRQAYDVSPTSKPNTVEKRACELLKNGKVAGRVAELQATHQQRHEITVDTLVAELEEARALAIKTEAPSAMVSATMGKGKLLGLIVDKSEIDGRLKISHEDALAELD